MIPVESLQFQNPEASLSRRLSSTVDAKFSTEKALVRKAVMQSEWSHTTSSNTGVVTELETPSGIVDIAFYRLRKDWKGHAVIGEIPSRWAYAFRQIPYRRRFSTDEFAAITATSSRRARLAILEFVKLGLCKPSKEGSHWTKTRQPYLALNELISVEAKLRDWRKALSQATRYLAYSDQSWVLLDARFTAPATKNIVEFERRNVGLATISTSGTVVFHFSPREARAIKPHDRWVVNSELLKRVKCV